MAQMRMRFFCEQRMTGETAEVLSKYRELADCQAAQPLGGGGGFSGARLWRVTAGNRNWCLRRWPAEHPTPRRLAWIHEVLTHVVSRGIDFIPAPIRCDTGESFVTSRGHLWEVAPWLPGEAMNPHDSTDVVSAAVTAVAQFHVAAATYHTTIDAPPGLASRMSDLVALKNRDLAAIRQSGSASSIGELGSLAAELADLVQQWVDPLIAEVETVIDGPVSLQPCLRDIWHDHLLFVGSRVSGLIDFGAMRTASVATDLARLLGSLAEQNELVWRKALDAYQTVRPLSDQEMALIPVFDRVGVILGTAHWLKWLLVERREFDDRRRVLERLEFLRSRGRCLGDDGLRPLVGP